MHAILIGWIIGVVIAGGCIALFIRAADKRSPKNTPWHTQRRPGGNWQ